MFGDELMVPVLRTRDPPLSLITIESLADIGYGVDVAGGDPYTLPGTGASRTARPSDGPVAHLGDDLLRRPILIVDRSGRVVRVYDPWRE